MSENTFQKLRDEIENGIVTGEFEPGQRLDVVYSPVRDRNGEGALEQRLHDLRPSALATT